MRTDLGWTLDPGVAFLNHGSYGACPQPVLDAQADLRARLERQPVAFLSRELPGRLDAARASVAAFLGADPAGLVFVANATTGCNAVLRSLRFDAGDELLTTDHEYNAILTTLQSTADRSGARVVIAPLPFPIRDADQLVEAVLAAVTPRTRLLVISHVTSPTAVILPVERLVRELDARGIDTLVDGAHAPGMVPLRLDDLGAAYYTGNGHKWLCAPKGAAFLWVRADRRDRVRPTVVSHGANDPRTDRGRLLLEFDWTGTNDPTAALTLPVAIDWMARSTPGGWPAIMAANHALALDGRDRVAAALGVAPPVPDDLLGSMAALPVPGLATDADGERWYDALVAASVEVPLSGWPARGARSTPDAAPAAVLLRISAQRYNEPADYDRLAASIREVRATAL